ncbi:hypothetical protein ACHAXS_014224 [Conticribra weissflogii]
MMRKNRRLTLMPRNKRNESSNSRSKASLSVSSSVLVMGVVLFVHRRGSTVMFPSKSNGSPDAVQNGAAFASLSHAKNASSRKNHVDAIVSPSNLMRQRNLLWQEQQRRPHLADDSEGGSRGAGASAIVDEPTLANSLREAQTLSGGYPEDKDGKNSQIAPPVRCSREMNAWCPPKNKCCPRFRSTNGTLVTGTGTDTGSDSDGVIVGYTCLGSSKGSYPVGSCCDSDSPSNIVEGITNFENDATVTGTGCAIGYRCASPARPDERADEISFPFGRTAPLNRRPHCRKDEHANPVDDEGRPIDVPYDLTPRYRNCPAFRYEDIAVPYGLGIPTSAAAYHDHDHDHRHHHDQNDRDPLKFEHGYIGKLAYFSNMGPIDHDDIHDFQRIIPLDGEGSIQTKRRLQQLQFNRESQKQRQSKATTAIVVIHGSGRNAASYLCSMIGALENVSSSTTPLHGMSVEDIVWGVTNTMEDENKGYNHAHQDGKNTRNSRKNERLHLGTRPESKPKKNGIGDALVISPWFLAPQDGDPNSSTPSPRDPRESLPFLQWDDDHPISHTFRYGAESLPNEHSEFTISSFAAIDVLLETLCDKRRFPNLDQIVVTGHSAGGQFVQRWGISSDSWCFGDERDMSAGTLPRVKLVPANPRSYAYLDGRRFLPLERDNSTSEGDENDPSMFHPRSEDSKEDEDVTLTFRFPNPSERDSCSEYNSYEWGLDDNPLIPAPYIISNTKKLMNESHDRDINPVYQRYASRDVVYLSGERDTEVLGPQICEDDGYQGPTRRQRSERFYASLQALWEHSRVDGNQSKVHDRILVENVGHDHALMFQSDEGLRGLFH